MWALQFGMVHEAVFYVFSAVAFVIVVLAVTGILSSLRWIDPSPGHSLSFFVDLSAIMLCVPSLLLTVKTTWLSRDSFQAFCQFIMAPMVIGSTMLTVCLVAKIAVIMDVYRFDKLRKEWPITACVLMSQLVAGGIVVTWAVLFTPGLHVVMTTNSTQPLYECRGRSPLGDDDWIQFVWRTSTGLFFTVPLVLATSLLPAMCTMRVPTEYWCGALAFVLMIMNTLVCLVAGLVFWFIYSSLGGVRTTVTYAVIGGLQLWVALFACVAILVSKSHTSKQCKKKETEERVMRYFSTVEPKAPVESYVLYS